MKQAWLVLLLARAFINFALILSCVEGEDGGGILRMTGYPTKRILVNSVFSPFTRIF